MRFLWILLFPCVVLADKVSFSIETAPWFTGPILAPSAYVVPQGHIDIQPYIYFTAQTGTYDNQWKVKSRPHTFWNNTVQVFAQVGLTSWLDIQTLPTFSYNYIDHAAHWALGDLPIGFDIQLYQPPDPLDACPAIKLTVRETFPIGKYQNLDPKKKLTDGGGNGTFNTALGLTFGKLWHLKGVSYLSSRLAFATFLPAPVHLKNLNVYGGGKGTNARFFPQKIFLIDLGLEVNLTKNWALANDFVASWSSHSHYTGKQGPAPLGSPASVQYSMAPALEYNWSAAWGALAGCWFTFAGKNAPRFWSAVISVNYYK